MLGLIQEVVKLLLDLHEDLVLTEVAQALALAEQAQDLQEELMTDLVLLQQEAVQEVTLVIILQDEALTLLEVMVQVQEVRAREVRVQEVQVQGALVLEVQAADLRHQEEDVK